VFRAVMAAQSHLVNKLDEELVRSSSIGYPEFEVLMFLAEVPEGAMRLSELADKVFLSRSALSRRIDSLSANGWVERRNCPTDGRGIYAVITSSGREKFEESSHIFNKVILTSIGDRLSSQEISWVSGALNKIVESL
jgi:DNA-binding MarR family transcriptional regulator